VRAAALGAARSLAARRSRGGTLYIGTDGTPVPSTLVVPSDCQPQPRTTKTECQAINQLWATKIGFRPLEWMWER